MSCRSIIFCVITLLLTSAACAVASTGWGLTLLTNSSEDSGTQVTIASFPGYTSGLDTEMPAIPDNGQFAAFIKVYHRENVNGWNSTTGWYSGDMRDLIPSGASVEFADIYIWAAPSYSLNTIPLEWYWHRGQSDPANWTFTLSLLSIPVASYTGQTSWNLEPRGSKTSPALLTELPTFRTADGLQGYRLRLTAVHTIPEPGGLVVLASAVITAFAGMRMRR